jgi:hypothetical protein
MTTKESSTPNYEEPSTVVVGEFHCACRFYRYEEFGEAQLLEKCGYHSKLEQWSQDVRLVVRGIDVQAERLTKREQITFRDGADQEPREEDFDDIITGYKLNTGLWHRLLGLLSSCPHPEGPGTPRSESATKETAGAMAVSFFEWWDAQTDNDFIPPSDTIRGWAWKAWNAARDLQASQSASRRFEYLCPDGLKCEAKCIRGAECQRGIDKDFP